MTYASLPVPNEPSIKEIETVYFDVVKRLSIRQTKAQVNKAYRAYLKKEGVPVYG